MLAQERLQTAGLDLEEAVERQIRQRTWDRVQQLHVQRQGDRVVVSGCSPSYYVKQLALLAVQEVCPSLPVLLDIEVARGSDRPLIRYHAS
jgi:hypothetical protein